MALDGTIIKHDGQLAFERKAAMLNEPKLVRHVWLLVGGKTSGMSWRGENEAIGKAASYRDGIVNCYLGDGCYFSARLPEFGATKAVVVETIDVPCPKVRGGIETRWQNFRWEKYLQSKGWVPA